MGAKAWRYSLVWAASVLCLARMANAQGIPHAIEHYPPLTPQGALLHRAITIAAPTVEADATPIGPPLNALVVEVPDGFTGQLTSLAGDERIKAVWQPFVGQPISRRMIAEIEAALTAQFDQGGYPVAVRWVADQDLSAGGLRFQLVDYAIDEVTVTGGRPGDADYLKSRLGLAKGKTVNSRQLAYDLDSLNRYPFRQTAAVLKPGKAGEPANIDLVVTRQKPWEAYVGLKYAGSDALTWRRYFAGGTIGNLFGRDSVLSFQTLGSPDVALHGKHHPKFVDTYFTYVIPVTRHAVLEASLEVDEINFSIAPQVLRLQDVIGAYGYRLLLPNHEGSVTARDVRFGVEAKHERAIFLSGGVATTQLAMEAYQVYVGYHTVFDDALGHNDLDMALRFSPGGLDAGNSDPQYVIYSEGRQKVARYAYVSVSHERTAQFAGPLSWHSQVSGQFATAALPYTEQASIGGLSLVRGYKLFDGSFDDAVVLRNEVGLKPKTGGDLTPNPYVFVDVGWGRDIGLKRSMVLASVGVGTSLHLTGHTSLRLNAVHTLRAGDLTAKDNNELEANLVFKF